ncbi:MAG: hypothetical protein ACRD47_09475 [Nitrososphaeraceae archaeon]
MSANINDLKKDAELHMQKEVEIMEMVMELDNNDIELFHRWYINHPYSKGIRELQQIVRNKAD